MFKLVMKLTLFFLFLDGRRQNHNSRAVAVLGSWKLNLQASSWYYRMGSSRNECTTYRPETSLKPPSPSSKPSRGRTKSLVAFVAPEGEAGSVYQVKGDAEDTHHQFAYNINMLNTDSLNFVY